MVELDIVRRVRTAAATALLLAASALTALPFAWLAAGSFKSTAEIFGNPLTFWPESISGFNYGLLFSGEWLPFGRIFLNTLAVAGFQTWLATGAAAMAAFVLGRYRFAGRRAAYGLVLAAVLIPPQILAIPLSLWIGQLGLSDTLLGIIFPGSASGLGVIFLTAIMRRLPGELFDAARVEGATEYALFWDVALPLARPGILAYSFLHFLLAWHDHLIPLIVLRTPERFTLGLAIASLTAIPRVPYGMLLASALITAAPTAAVYLMARRNLARALADVMDVEG